MSGDLVVKDFDGVISGVQNDCHGVVIILGIYVVLVVVFFGLFHHVPAEDHKVARLFVPTVVHGVVSSSTVWRLLPVVTVPGILACKEVVPNSSDDFVLFEEADLFDIFVLQVLCENADSAVKLEEAIGAETQRSVSLFVKLEAINDGDFNTFVVTPCGVGAFVDMPRVIIEVRPPTMGLRSPEVIFVRWHSLVSVLAFATVAEVHDCVIEIVVLGGVDAILEELVRGTASGTDLGCEVVLL